MININSQIIAVKEYQANVIKLGDSNVDALF